MVNEVVAALGSCSQSSNPVGLCSESQPPPGGVVVFGASGDLTRRKVAPALFGLFRRNLIPQHFFLVGCARSPFSAAEFRSKVAEAVKDEDPSISPADIERFLQRCAYVAGDYDDPETYRQLAAVIEDFERPCRKDQEASWNRLLYLATPPRLHASIVAGSSQAGLTSHHTDPRQGPSRVVVVVEKPFGHDVPSSRTLDQWLGRHLTEDQIFRIDHYLGKETVQNVFMLRFANSLFEPVWNRNHIDSIQITVAESLGIGHRAGYYDSAGAIRDMVQNHLLQLLSLVAMDAPASFRPEDVRSERSRILRSLRPFDSADEIRRSVVRGQYEGYRDEGGVKSDSTTETYIAMRVMMDSWRWEGVPFYLRTGKCLTRKLSEIVVTFRPVPVSVLGPTIPSTALTPTTLVLTIQPHEGGSLTLQAKHPGARLCLAPLTMQFCYQKAFGGSPPDAYQRLLLDAMIGDQTLFVRRDSMDLSWQFIQPILDAVCSGDLPVLPYSVGSDGPVAAHDLLRSDDRCWRPLDSSACP